MQKANKSPYSGLRRLAFAIDGREGGDEQRRKRHKESGDRLRRTAGLHLPIQSKGAKCDSRRPKTFRLALQQARCRTGKLLTFRHKRACFSKSQKTQKPPFHSRHFAPRCAFALSTPWPIGGAHPSTRRPAVAPPCGRRARPPCRKEENNTTFAPKSTPFRPKCTTLRPFPTRGRHDTRPRIRASVEVHFLPSPFTFISTTLIYKRLRVNITPVFCFTEVKAKGVKPSHLSPCYTVVYER